MAIKNIKVEKFTVFENLEIEFSDGVNVFIGDNGTGKTHLLKLLYALCNYEYNKIKNDVDLKEQFMEELRSIFQGDYDYRFIKNHMDDKNANFFVNERGNIDDNLNSLPKALIKISFFSDKTKHELVLLYHVVKATELPPVHGNSRRQKKKIPSVFIPAKDMLSHSGLEKDFAERNLTFDTTLIDILNKAGVSTLRNVEKAMCTIMDKISKIIGGKIVYKNDRYFVEKLNGMLVEFSLEAEGFKKLGALYRLIETGHIKNGCVLIWDEPESNLNPKNIPILVNLLLELSRNGVQVFLATHEYNLMKYFSIKMKATDKVAFHCLYHGEEGVECESEEDYDLLNNNLIIDADIQMVRDEIGGNA